MSMICRKDNDPTGIIDEHFSLNCPNCQAYSNITAISIPRYEQVHRYQPKRVGIVYRCDSCNEPIFLRFDIDAQRSGGNQYTINDTYFAIERPKESFDYRYLPDSVSSDFKEALTCFSNSCFNAFAAMCRRCSQSIFTELGADGKDRVLNQLKDIRDTADIDDETYEVFEQIIISGHDGVHPNLPEVMPERANILLELMKDVLNQLFVRKAKIRESIDLRLESISLMKNDQ